MDGAPDGTFFGDRDCDGEAKQKADAYVGVEGVAQRVTVVTDTPETWEAVARAAHDQLPAMTFSDLSVSPYEWYRRHLARAIRAAFIGEDAT